MARTKLPLINVTWDDAWIDPNEPVLLSEVHIHHKPKVIVTLGYLLREDEVGISLANEYYKDEDCYRGRTFIPRLMVKSVELSRLSKPRAKKTPPYPASNPPPGDG